MFTRTLAIIISLLSVAIARAETITEYVNYCGPFDKIEVLDNVNVIYKCMPDSAGYMRYNGARRFNDAFIVENKKGKLKIQVNTDDVNDPQLPEIYVYSNFLTSVANSSDHKLEVLSIAPCPNLTIKQIGNGIISVDGVQCDKVTAVIATGNGTITVTGATDEAKLKMIGTGTIQADLLQAKTVSCTVVGSGTIGCWPEQSLNVKGLGSTKVYYRGDPALKKGPGLKVYSLDEPVPAETLLPDYDNEPAEEPAAE